MPLILTKVQNRKSIKAQIILINNDDRLHHSIFITIWNVIYIWYSIKFNKNYDDWILIERITSINQNMFQFFVSDPVLILSFFYLSLFQPYSTIFLWTEGTPNWNTEQETNPRIWHKKKIEIRGLLNEWAASSIKSNLSVLVLGMQKFEYVLKCVWYKALFEICVPTT